jgi:RNA polymerase sigma-70 factor (ECF subfamily)
LVSKAQRGDTAAFEELVCRYDRKVLSIARSFTRDPDEANDIYQEVFLRVYRALGKFEFESEFSTWLHRIAMNVCLDHKRAAGRATRESIEDIPERELRESPANPNSGSRAASPESLAHDGEIRRHVEAALETLSPQERLVFTLKHFEDLKLREIAVMMECTEGTVKRYLFTAVAKMRRGLKRIYR